MMCFRIVPMHCEYDARFERNFSTHHSTMASTVPPPSRGGRLSSPFRARSSATWISRRSSTAWVLLRASLTRSCQRPEASLYLRYQRLPRRYGCAIGASLLPLHVVARSHRQDLTSTLRLTVSERLHGLGIESEQCSDPQVRDLARLRLMVDPRSARLDVASHVVRVPQIVA